MPTRWIENSSASCDKVELLLHVKGLRIVYILLKHFSVVFLVTIRDNSGHTCCPVVRLQMYACSFREKNINYLTIAQIAQNTFIRVIILLNLYTKNNRTGFEDLCPIIYTCIFQMSQYLALPYQMRTETNTVGLLRNNINQLSRDCP